MTTKHESTAHGDELLPGQNIGGYVVHSKVGEGGMGLVYRAQHPSIGKRVAIKVLGPVFSRDEEVVARFEQEARLVNEIHHPNIVDIFQFGNLPDGRKFMVMELLEGESLSGRIERGQIPAHEAAEILDGIADALIATHAKNIVHRDLKSDNVFIVTAHGRSTVKLLDFGLAKLSGNDPRAITKTKTGIVVGTPHYMSPEQIRGKPADQRTDVYALGILAFKMMSGKVPWDGLPTDLLIHHLKTPPPNVMDTAPATPAPLAQMIQRMMAKEPDQRPSLPELRNFLVELRAGRATGSMAPMASSPGMTAQSSQVGVAAGNSVVGAPAPAAAGRPAWLIPVLVLAVLASAGIAFGIVYALKHG